MLFIADNDVMMSDPSQALRQRLRNVGLRATPQRLAIAELLLADNVHITAQALYGKLKDRFPSLSPNTVYLTLSQFEERGLVRRLYVHSTTVFDSNTEAHAHACCRLCGRLVDLTPQAQEPPPQGLSGWHLEGESHIWYGLCPECNARSEA